jgi:hypothetical protein
MSDNYLRLIPSDPHLMPPDVVANQIVSLLRPAFPEADRVTAEYHDHPVFVDQGTNLEAVLCRACGRRLPFGPGLGDEGVWQWWYDLTEHLAGGSVTDVQVTMPCCHARLPFAALEFDWPAGVASFEVSIRNPRTPDGPSPELQRRVEALLGSPIKVIWAHY